MIAAAKEFTIEKAQKKEVINGKYVIKKIKIIQTAGEPCHICRIVFGGHQCESGFYLGINLVELD